MGASRIKWRERMPENDIKYGGFLSYRHLRIIGWVCLIIAQVSLILKLEAKLAPDTKSIIETWNIVISIFGGLPVPLFLLANLSTILQQRGDYKTLFIRYGGLAAGMFLLANFLVFHYGYRTLLSLNLVVNWADAARFFGEMLPTFGKSAYTLNIFIDMLLVVLMFFFANYVPKAKVFQGKRIAFFRLMILLPIAYEIAGILLKYNVGMGSLVLSSPVIFLLPSKPPLIFAAFVIIVIALKVSQVAYIHRKGNSEEKYEEHVKTKAHALKISVGISVVFAIMAVVDLILFVALFLVTFAQYSVQYADLPQETIELLILYRMDVFENIGIGSATGLLLAIPIVLLFSYTKTHKNPKIDTLIPIVGIGLLVLVLFEGFFQVITLNMPMFIQRIKDAATKAFGGADGGEGEALELRRLFLGVRNFLP